MKIILLKILVQQRGPESSFALAIWDAMWSGNEGQKHWIEEIHAAWWTYWTAEGSLLR